jgi:tetratricopeptide (TPR) repeat protein
VPPAEALRSLLDAFHVPPERIPRDAPACAALYRSLLAGRRVLVVLDNARDSEQVQPLIPGASGCLVVATSRDQLPGLTTAGARPLALDLLTERESHDLLASRIGSGRLKAEPAAVHEIIRRCARLPLALAVVGARAATYPRFALDALADELGEPLDTLDLFLGGEAGRGVRAAFSSSYRTLSDPAARLFRLLGIHPGPEVGLAAAASLAGAPVPAVRRLLAELVRAQMITERTPGRYGFHDLLRAYAGELARGQDRTDEHRAAMRRCLDHYAHTAYAAANLINPRRDPPPPAPAAPGVVALRFDDQQDALRWYVVEQRTLLEAVAHALAGGYLAHTCQLASAIEDFLTMRAEVDALAATQQAALTAATRLGDRRALAAAHRGLAVAYGLLKRFADSGTYLRRAAELFGEAGDHIGEARAWANLGILYEHLGDHRAALDHGLRGLALLRAHSRDDCALSLSLGNIGWHYANLGEYEQALELCEEALALVRQTGDRYGEAQILDSLGYVHHRLGQLPRAISRYRRAAALISQFGDLESEGKTLDDLGDCLSAAGDARAARQAWRRALALLDEVGDPAAELIRAKLAGAGQVTGASAGHAARR